MNLKKLCKDIRWLKLVKNWGQLKRFFCYFSAIAQLRPVSRSQIPIKTTGTATFRTKSKANKIICSNFSFFYLFTELIMS